MYLCRCKRKEIAMLDEKTLQEKACKYLVCFNEQCLRHEHCLRWQVGLHVPADRWIVTTINPRNTYVAAGECPYYRDDKPVRIPKGMVNFFEDMPLKQARFIKAAFIQEFTHIGYYHYRNGSKQITPDVVQVMEEICRKHGWTQPLAFDEYVEEVLW